MGRLEGYFLDTEEQQQQRQQERPPSTAKRPSAASNPSTSLSSFSSIEVPPDPETLDKAHIAFLSPRHPESQSPTRNSHRYSETSMKSHRMSDGSLKSIPEGSGHSKDKQHGSSSRLSNASSSHVLISRENHSGHHGRHQLETQRLSHPGDDVSSLWETTSSSLKLMEQICRDVEALPSANTTNETDDDKAKPRSSEFRYDNSGRITKNSFNSSASSMQPGAYKGTSNRQYGHVIEVPDYSHTVGLSSRHEEDPIKLHATKGPTTVSRLANDEEDAPPPKWWQKRSFVATIVVTVILLLAAVAVVVVLVAIPSSQSSISSLPEATPEGDQDMPTGWLVPNLTNATLEALADIHSQQYQAYNWISKDPNWNDYEEYRQQQRFALACLYYGFQIVEHGPSFQPSYGKSECDWFRLHNACEHGERNVATSIVFARPHFERIELVGSIPPQVALLTQLEVLDLTANYLRVSLEALLPLDTIRGLPRLKELRCHDCRLYGSLPSTVGLLTSLTSLDLSENELSGFIPTHLGFLSNLSSLLLSSNDLSGTIPEQLGNVSALEVDDNLGIIESSTAPVSNATKAP